MTKDSSPGSADSPAHSSTRDYLDEISIIELIQDIGRQWKTVVGAILVCAAAVWLYSFFKVEIYRYTVNLEIGQVPRKIHPQGGNFIMVPPARLDPVGFDSPRAVISQLESEWLIQAIDDVVGEAAEKFVARLGDFRISNPDDTWNNDSLLIRLVVTAPMEQDAAIREVLGKSVVRVVKEHTSYLEKIRTRSERRLAQVRRNQTIKDGQIQEFDARIRHLRALVTGERKDAVAAAMEIGTLLSERKELQQESQKLLDAIAEREYEVEVLTAAIEAGANPVLNADTLQHQLRAFAAVYTVLAVQPTRILNLPKRSSKPEGVDSKLVLLLSLVVGLIVGLFLALVIEAMKRVRAA